MKTIPEAERRQLLAATSGSKAHARKGVGIGPTAPVVPMADYFRQLEQLRLLFPDTKFVPARGEHWKL